MIGFKFCGGCNPLYDRKKVYSIVSQLFNDEEVTDRGLQKQILIILNGCQRGCVKPKQYKEIFDEILDIQQCLVSLHTEEIEDIVHWIQKKVCNQ